MRPASSITAGSRRAQVVAPLLDMIEAQAQQADATRSVSTDTLAALRASGVLAMSASKELGGAESTVSEIAAELEAVAAVCSSTAWCLWNHLCVFHLFCGALGPVHSERLAGIVERRDWVCFPGGAGSRLLATPKGESLSVTGRAAFGSGCQIGRAHV